MTQQALPPIPPWPPHSKAAHRPERKLRFTEEHVRGYGGPGYSACSAIYAGKVLKRVQVDEDSRQFGRAQLLLEQEFEAKTLKQLDELAGASTKEGGWCDVCGVSTLGGTCSYCVEMTFCEKCATKIDDYRALWDARDRVLKDRAKIQQAAQDERFRRREEQRTQELRNLVQSLRHMRHAGHGEDDIQTLTVASDFIEACIPHGIWYGTKY